MDDGARVAAARNAAGRITVTPARWQQVKAALHQALELQSESRLAYIAEVTADDEELRVELESLIAAHEGSGESFLSIPAAALQPVVPSGPSQADAQIGNYRLLRELGRGGMGQVWLAEQTAPVRRLVALKLIRAGMYDDAVLKRFEAERQSLAMMDHPAIAKVFDAGSSNQGQPYLVMEYVPGLPITEYCDQKRLTLRERLELFVQACDGVQHAHQKAVIHRDLKPDNILIIEVDGKAVPRIIDFGLAKPTVPWAPGEAPHTQLGQFIGTPGYMSPEQADPDIQDIDTRTDVYSLGVILYVLLAGRQPFETKERHPPPLDEWLRQLRDDEPPGLAAKVSADRDSATAIAAARSDEPRKLVSQLRGDLDWITMKAIERNRERRYGTPSELAADLRRYLNNEAVVARPASAAYQIRQFARRHRVAIASAGALLLVLAGGLAATTYEALVASKERDAAQQAQLHSLTQTAAARLREADVPAALGIILQVLPHRGAQRPYLPEALSVFQEARVADAQVLAITGHADSILSAAFSPDGLRVVTGSGDMTARIWDAGTGQQIAQLNAHTNQVNSAVFSPDGRRVVTASHDKTARIWDAANGRELLLLTGHTDRVWSAAFSPDGSRVVTASKDNSARIWDAATGRQIMLLAGHTAAVHSAAFSPDGQRIVTASYDKTARIWDAATGRQIMPFAGHTDLVLSAAFSPDGRRIVTASIDGTARVWDVVSGQQILLLVGHANWLASAAFSPDGGRIVTASYDKTARIWDAATGRQMLLLSGHATWLACAAFSPDGRYIVTASHDKTARIWDIAIPRQTLLLRGHSSFLNSAVFSPDGGRIATAANDKTARIWDAATGQQMQVLSGHTDMVNSVAFSPDGGRILTTSNDKTARIWDVATGRQMLLLSGHTGSVTTSSFSPDGSRVVTGSYDKTARIWNAVSGQQLLVISGHTKGVSSAAFSPDGKRVVTASWDSTARIWDAATGRRIMQLNGHTARVHFAAFSPDGKRVVTASYDNTARIWDAATGRQLTLLSGHTDSLASAVFSPDGERVLTASHDRTARIWDTATGRQLVLLSGHTSLIESAAFSPDGWRVVTASDDETARVWDVRAPALDIQIEWAEAAQFDPLSNSERFQLGVSAPTAVRRWRLPASPCDEAAAAPYDPDRRAPGVMLEQIVADIAVSACTDRESNADGKSRSEYQLGRIQMAGGQYPEARRAFEAAVTAGYRSAGVDLGMLLSAPSAGMPDLGRVASLYEQAWRHGVPIAGFKLGHLYEVGAQSGLTPVRAEFSPNATQAWQWYQQAADSGEPDALARFAQRAQVQALAATNVSQRNAQLLLAFGFYAAAAERARYEDWPDEAWKDWRYRRASLARVLANEGMMQQVAEAYAAVLGRWSKTG
jgi:eukaryotic-like serine/threonine-protein kinase